MKALSEKSNASRKRKIILISSIVGALVIGAGVYAYFAIKQQQQTNENIQRDASTVKEEQVKNNEGTDQSQLPSKSDSQNQTPPPSPDTPSTPPEKPVLERASGDPTLKVVATFQKASSGTCELQLSAPGQQTKTYTSNVVVGSSYYTCSFSIPRSSLPAGSWSAVVVHRIGNASTSSDSRSLDS